MKKTRIPPMFADLVQISLVSCDGMLFEEAVSCPECGGQLGRYDEKKKRFAVVSENEKMRTIFVRVRRFQCRSCRKIITADQPFYPETRIGSPVIDLCIALGEMMPYSRVSACLADMGVIVDRWSVRNYVKGNARGIPMADMFGLRIPLSIISLSTLAGAVSEGQRMDARAMLAACGYPSRRIMEP